MKLLDFIFILLLGGIIALLAFYPPSLEGFKYLNATHPFLMAFTKFAFLATFGEMLGLRIKKGLYYEKGFGLLSRAFVWGWLGILIAIAFEVFASGIPALLFKQQLISSLDILKEDLSFEKVLCAFCISIFMNIIFAPVMMTLHKITDEHIIMNQGHFLKIFRPIPFSYIMSEKISWKVMWGFVFAKTIPLFWIPAHTLTFLLPPDFRVVFAALLGIVLGVILATSSLKQKS